MRWLYSLINLRKGECEIVDGKLRVAKTLVRSASLHALVSDMIRTCEGHHVYLLAVAPKDISPGLYGDFESSRLTYVVCNPDDYHVGFYPMHFHLDGVIKRFQFGGRNSRFVPLPLDVVCATSPFGARRIMMQLASRVRDVPAVCRHESSYGAAGNSIEAWGKPGNDIRLRRAMGAESMGYGHIFLSGKDRKNYTDLFIRRNLAASAVREFMDDSRVLPNGVDIEHVQRLCRGIRRTPGTVGSFSRPTTQKGTRTVLELYQRMALAGQIARAVVTWNRADDLAEFMGCRPSGKFDFHPNCSRDQYLKLAAETGCMVSNSTNESSPFLVVECMALGVVPILPVREWTDSMPEEWPLRFRTMDEAARLIHLVFEDQAGWSKQAREYAKRNYNAVERCGAFLSEILTRSQASGVFSRMDDDRFAAWCEGSKIVASIGELLDGRGEIGWVELFKSMKFPHNPIGEQIMLTHNDLPDLICRKFGFVDDLKSAIPRFVREC